MDLSQCQLPARLFEDDDHVSRLVPLKLLIESKLSKSELNQTILDGWSATLPQRHRKSRLRANAHTTIRCIGSSLLRVLPLI